MSLLESALSQNSEDDGLFKAKISVCGVGGGGSNTIQRMSKMGIVGANLIAANTDGKHLNTLDPTIKRVLIGGPLTRGLGAGGFPEMGAKAAEFSKAELERAMEGSNLLFVTAGMGGGTGTGAAPVIAQLAKNSGSLVVGIVTYPFRLERVRLQVANRGIEELRKNVDTLIVIDNQRLVEVYKNLQIDQAFKVADEIASRAVKGITETINRPGLINVDFADIRSIMTNGGIAMISIGEGHGSSKVDDVVRNTLQNKLLDVDYEGTTGIMIYIVGGDDLTLGDSNEIARKLTERAAPNANVIWGARIEPEYNGRVEVIAIFTGVKSPQMTAGASGKEPQEDYGLGWA
ncbi:TPA: cell division protein FtsZ [Candidatus Micrarchaeota archaeon]|jgi:cell division protein FtsZ|nr:cell division protein FtsZ [Candidatus Micrarchaeota archaeon]